jgi:1,4-alpha-glucan branching enzyme
MVELARRHPSASDITRRALNQAARELLLAQSSDWPFIMKTKQAVDFAVRHARVHLSRFRRLRHELDVGRVDSGWLSDLEWRDNVFPHIDYEVYA